MCVPYKFVLFLCISRKRHALSHICARRLVFVCTFETKTQKKNNEGKNIVKCGSRRSIDKFCSSIQKTKKK